jgi:polysaccharide transporter, PST family
MSSRKNQQILANSSANVEVGPEKRFFNRQGLRESIFWLSLLQVVNYLLPIATVPYLIRILGASNFGILALASAVAQWLVVFTDYGFNLSATRQIAIEKDYPEKIDRLVSAVLFIKVVLLIIAALIMTLLVTCVNKFQPHRAVFACAFLIVVGSVGFPSWFFQALQDMKAITVITSLGRIFCTIAIFLVVAHPSDIRAAAFWSAAGSPLAAILSWVVIRYRYRLRLSIPSVGEIRTALRDGYHIFISSVMANALANSAVLVLGFLQPMDVVGTYAAMEKVAKAATMTFAPITQSLYPHTSSHFAKGHAQGRKFVARSGSYVIGLAVAVSGALAGFSPLFIKLVYGSRFAPYAGILRVLSLWLLFGVINNILGIQYLLGSGRARAYSYAFTASTIVTVVLLFALIPLKPYIGAALAVTLGEVVLTLLMMVWILRRRSAVA